MMGSRNIINKSKFGNWRAKNILVVYLVAFAFGVFIGLKIIPGIVIGLVYLFLVGICLIFCFKGDIGNFFKYIPFAIYLEVYMRDFVKWVPYLTLQYLFIIVFSVFILRGMRQKENHFKGVYFLVFFSFLEITNNLHPSFPANTRAILVNSLALLMPALWASLNDLKPALINKLLDNIKIAGMVLTGIVFVAHVTGNINYGLFSSSEASNGLAPVQLSGYLGTVCILFFLSIMNPEEIKNRTTNIIFMTITTTIMILTFSRGGLYFLIGVMGIFFFYNRHKLGQYVKLIALVPIGFIIYYVVVNQTGGKIVERYGQEGTSNRDVLVDIGFKIFWKNPYFGVGTGNYNEAIVQENYFKEESGAHNEFVRAAAEHGIVGIIGYWSFFLLLFLEIIHRRQPQQQYAMYFFALFCLIIVHNGLKIAIQPMILMLVIGTPGLKYLAPQNVFRRELQQSGIA